MLYISLLMASMLWEAAVEAIDINRSSAYFSSEAAGTMSRQPRLHVQHSSSHIHCALICAMIAECGGINWNMDSHYCELIEGFTTTSNIIWTTTSRFYQKNNIELSTPCASNPCQGGSTCMDSGSAFVCECSALFAGQFCEIDCSGLSSCPVEYHKDNVVTVTVSHHDQSPVNLTVLTDSGTYGNDWIVMMRRTDGSTNFTRPWDDYQEGFGTFEKDFWLGNEAVHLLTTNGSSWRLRIDMMKDYDSRKEYRYAEYNMFWIDHGSASYVINIDGYSGNAGDSFRKYGDRLDHDGRNFSTFEQIEENPFTSAPSRSCANKNFGGWWYSKCFFSLLTGEFKEKMAWESWLGKGVSLDYADMKIKPV